MTEEQNSPTTSTSGDGEAEGTPWGFLLLLFVVVEAFVIGFSQFVVAGPGIRFAIWAIVAQIGIVVIVAGVPYATMNTSQPLTPVRAGAFPVVAGALALVAFSFYLSPDSEWKSRFIGTAAVVAAFCGVPLGAAVKRKRPAMAFASVSVGVAAISAVRGFYTYDPYHDPFPLFSIIFFLVLLGYPATILGYWLTSSASD